MNTVVCHGNYQKWNINIMATPAKLPILGSQIKAEFGQASMAECIKEARYSLPFSLSNMVGKSGGNFWISVAAIPGVSGGFGYSSVAANKGGSIPRNQPPADKAKTFTGLASFISTPTWSRLVLNNWTASRYDFDAMVDGGQHPYLFAKHNTLKNTYELSAGGGDGSRFYNLMKSNAGKIIHFNLRD